ncbi:Nuclear transport factor 2 [Tulasnella sp. UAMH 9824]|nr:Nuclear transport factor 2 [Tulasnella sp. UAMH 9824]
MASPQEIAAQFVQYYYNTFDTNRAALNTLYSLPFTTVKHQVTTLDAQAASASSLIVMVTGALAIDDSPPMQYSQCFQLAQDGGSFFVSNDIFRLNLG